MTTPTPTVGTYRLTWLAGYGERAALSVQDVQADSFEIHESTGFIYFRAGVATVLSIRTDFVVSIGRLATPTDTDKD